MLVYNGLGGTPRGQKKMLDDQCLVDTCFLTDDHKYISKADAILFQGSISAPSTPKPPGQVWILYFLESPRHTQSLAHVKDKVSVKGFMSYLYCKKNDR